MREEEKFKKAVEPVIKWLNKNCHPHCYIVIQHTNAELLEGKMCHYTEKFLVD